MPPCRYAASLLLILALPSLAQLVERGGKTAGSGAATPAHQGASVAISADGLTMIEGGPEDEQGRGAVWLFLRTASGWSQQGEKLTAREGARFGQAVALSGDGNTALVSGQGAAWVFTRSNGVWTQQSSVTGGPGAAVAISADGNTALFGTMVLKRSGALWTQQAALGEDDPPGQAALSADGNTALIGSRGAAWVFTRSGDSWSTTGTKLAGDAAKGSGISIALSADGRTTVLGSDGARGGAGAAWVFTRSGDIWTQVARFAGSEGAHLGFSAALSADGVRLLLGAPGEGAGTVWDYGLRGGEWSLIGKLTGRGAKGRAQMGYSLAVSADAGAVVTGGALDDAGGGAVWTFGIPVLLISAPDSAVAGAPVLLSVTAQDGAGNIAAGYRGMVHLTSSDGRAELPPDAALVEGKGTFPITFKTAGAQTVAAADVTVAAIAAVSGSVPVSAGPAAELRLEAPDMAQTGQNVEVTVTALDAFQNLAELQGAVRFRSSDPRAELPPDVRLGGPRSGSAILRFATPGKQTITATVASVEGAARIALVGAVNSSDYVSTVLATNPLAYFRLQAANDTSQVNGYTSTFQATAQLASPGAPVCEASDNYASLDGLAGWVSTSLTGGIAMAGSVVAWVNLSELPSTAGQPMYIAGESQSGDDFDLQFTADNHLRFYVSNNGINLGYQPASSTLVGQWHMIAAVFNGATNTEQLYWDGQLVASGTNTVIANKTTQFNIGNSTVLTGSFFAGGIQEVAVWNTALTAAQVSTIYSSAACSSVSLPDTETIHVADNFSALLSLFIPTAEPIQVIDSPNLISPLPASDGITFGVTVSLVVNPAYSPCDVNQDRSTNVLDAQMMIQEALGAAAPLNDLNGDGVVDVVDIQTVIGAVMTGTCLSR